jgi:hypothetical protein
MRLALAALAVLACSPNNRANEDAAAPADSCSGLECKVVDCEKTGRPATTVSGTVFAPNGTLALFGVSVYVPASFPLAFPEGATCARCEELSGGVVAKAVSDESGKFTLTGVPAGKDIPVVITIGKWRRQITIPTVTECTDNPVPNGVAALPRNHTEGDIPKIAITAGSCDALECLIRKIGVSDFEFSPDTGTGRIHLFASNGAAKMADGTPFSTAFSLWESVDKLKKYDLVLNSCECSERETEKTLDMMNAIKAYADGGGRLFNSHFHNVWIGGDDGDVAHRPPIWPLIANCNQSGSASAPGTIDQVNNPKGPAFAAWMLAVGGSTTPGIIPTTEPTNTCQSIDNAKAERWVYQGGDKPQMFQFTTPNESPLDARCGKVVFADMHVSGDSNSTATVGFPGGCAANNVLTPQEKALAFMFFDIASCVGPIN